MAAKKTLVGPRITSLEQALTSGDATALDTFWQEVIEHGTPLMEPIEGDDEHYLVTFLWRDRGGTQNVVVFAGPAGWDHPKDNEMMRLLDTDLWYRTYQVRANLRTIYLLSPNDPLSELGYGVVDFGIRIVPDPLNLHQFVYRKDEEIPDDRDTVVSVLELPAAPPQPWIAPRPGVAQGQIEMHRLRSHILNVEISSHLSKNEAV